MTKEEPRSAFDSLVYLVSCAVREEIPDREAVEKMDLDRVYEAAAFHGLAAAAGMALQSAGVNAGKFRDAVVRSQRRIILLDRDRAAILQELEKAGIWYMPLKGILLKDWYPKFGMREMADNDILVDPRRMKDIRKIMENLGFSVEDHGTGAHDVFYKKPVSNFEIHRKLFSSNEAPGLAAYYADVKDRLVRAEEKPGGGNRHEYRFTDEDFYLYLTAHEYKHYSENGTGLRSLLDIYIFLRHAEPDREYVARETPKMGIAEFELANRELARTLFSGEALTPAQREMLDRMACSGSYGKPIEGVQKKIAEKGRFGYVLSRLTLPYADMQDDFPVLRKAPVLYPACWAWRLVRGLSPKRRKKAALELKAVMGLEKSETNEKSVQPEK